MRKLFFLAFVLTLAIPAAARADTFTYTFSWPTFSDSFVLTSPVLITTPTTLAATSCLYGGVACTSVEVDPVTVAGFSFYDSSNVLIGTDSNFDASWFTVGTHVDVENGITLTVVDSPAQTPEPSSLVLLGTGLLGTLGAARKRYLRA